MSTIEEIKDEHSKRREFFEKVVFPFYIELKKKIEPFSEYKVSYKRFITSGDIIIRLGNKGGVNMKELLAKNKLEKRERALKEKQRRSSEFWDEMNKNEEFRNRRQERQKLIKEIEGIPNDEELEENDRN